MGYSAYEVLNTSVLYHRILLARHVCSYGKKKALAAIKKKKKKERKKPKHFFL